MKEKLRLNRKVCLKSPNSCSCFISFFPLNIGMDFRDMSEDRKTEIQMELKFFPISLCLH